MKKALSQFLKHPAMLSAFLTALMFQLIFSVIWMTGYDQVTDNTKNLKIAMVNEDAGIGKTMVAQLSQNLPFKTQIADSRQAAQDLLEEREVQLVMVIPQDFSKQLQAQGQQAKIDYIVNESNPQMIKGVMQAASASITASANKQAVAAGMQAVLGQMKVPAQQAQGLAQGLSEKVVGNVQSVHPVKGMNNQMVPMMMVLASFVGAMIMQMSIQQIHGAVSAAAGKWNGLAARSAINLVSALVIAAIGSSLVFAFGGQHEAGFAVIWLFQSLFLAAFMFLAQMFLMLFGLPGMLFNIICLSAQLVTSGAMVPRELLSGFYHGLGDYLPATYAVRGTMNLLFGGPGVASSTGWLAVILLVCLAVAAVGTLLRKQPAPVDGQVELASGQVERQ
jgi:YhgE/Pip-like protein